MNATTPARRYALICNPTARSGRGRRAWHALRQKLDAAKSEYVLLESEYPGHAVTLATQQAQIRTPVVVAVGGDGTINEVLEGLMQGAPKAGERPALGILYTGTSPDVCRYHRIPVELDAAIGTLLCDQRRLIDVGEVRYHATERSNLSGFDKICWFLCSVNLGMGASIAEGSNRGFRRYWGDTLGTLMSLVRTAVRFQPIDLTCIVDGKPLQLTRVLNLTIGKNPHIASGIRLGIPIAADDGSLYLFAARGFSLLGFLGQLPRLYRGTFQDHPNNYQCRLNTFACAGLAGENALEFDGDARGYLPCSIRILPRSLNLIVPGVNGVRA